MPQVFFEDGEAARPHFLEAGEDRFRRDDACLEQTIEVVEGKFIPTDIPENPALNKAGPRGPWNGRERVWHNPERHLKRICHHEFFWFPAHADAVVCRVVYAVAPCPHATLVSVERRVHKHSQVCGKNLSLCWAEP